VSTKKVYIFLFRLSSFPLKYVLSDKSMDAQKANNDAFLREWTIPEEDRAKYTTQPWAGEYRWFRSPNVVCLEQYRRRSKEQEQT
jgi:hypothetical protein